MQWVKKKAGKPATLVETVEAVKKAEGEADVIAVGYFPKLEVLVYGYRSLYPYSWKCSSLPFVSKEILFQYFVLSAGF